MLARLDLLVESEAVNDGESRPERWRTGWWDSFQQKEEYSLSSFH